MWCGVASNGAGSVPQRLGGEEEERQRHFYVRHLWAGAGGGRGGVGGAQRRICNVLVGSLLRALTPVPDTDVCFLLLLGCRWLDRKQRALEERWQQLRPGPGHGRLIESTSPTWKEMVTEPGI